MRTARVTPAGVVSIEIVVSMSPPALASFEPTMRAPAATRASRARRRLTDTYASSWRRALRPRPDIQSSRPALTSRPAQIPSPVRQRATRSSFAIGTPSSTSTQCASAARIGYDFLSVLAHLTFRRHSSVSTSRNRTTRAPVERSKHLRRSGPSDCFLPTAPCHVSRVKRQTCAAQTATTSRRASLGWLRDSSRRSAAHAQQVSGARAAAIQHPRQRRVRALCARRGYEMGRNVPRCRCT
ncbi:hypothetical protein EXIGLDRAFT_278367 [Exidia glandulosa HHB12029]|uniref:Uncharacterized protein n=1 Tax=Exidia glandulosa HHB12029 TaxID=1314781 RepID=A0A165DKR2_EXIGL|nr:hypothetical protein EXIGLDRAFT_278367 [Exidia glandulosa HHB12029]